MTYNVQLTEDELGILKIITGFSVYALRELETSVEEPKEHKALLALNHKLITEYESEFVGPNASEILQGMDNKFVGYLSKLVTLAASDKLAEILGSNASGFAEKLKKIINNPGGYKVSVVDIGELGGILGGAITPTDEPSINLPVVEEGSKIIPKEDKRKFTLD